MIPTQKVKRLLITLITILFIFAGFGAAIKWPESVTPTAKAVFVLVVLSFFGYVARVTYLKHKSRIPQSSTAITVASPTRPTRPAPAQHSVRQTPRNYLKLIGVCTSAGMTLFLLLTSFAFEQPTLAIFHAVCLAATWKCLSIKKNNKSKNEFVVFGKNVLVILPIILWVIVFAFTFRAIETKNELKQLRTVTEKVSGQR